MSVEYRIRPFEPEDLDRLHEVRTAAFKPVFKSFREIVGKKIAVIALADAEREQAELLDKMCEDSSPHNVLVLEQDGSIVGFCGVKVDDETKVGEIDLNAVHPDAQGEGLGNRLV
ncbi:MAG: GNAT family N-acetyltransferase [Hyphomicrobiaceae bacterium]|nr:GNAT family N-acetyltransferase [Hyphomicrobiaceae bacterium]